MEEMKAKMEKAQKKWEIFQAEMIINDGVLVNPSLMYTEMGVLPRINFFEPSEKHIEKAKQVMEKNRASGILVAQTDLRGLKGIMKKS